jgi:hypothetical protein
MGEMVREMVPDTISSPISSPVNGQASNVAYGIVFDRAATTDNTLASQTLINFEESYDAPWIASTSLINAMVGSQLVITGTNFGGNQGNSTVTFTPLPTANQPSPPPVNMNVISGSWSGNQIVVSVPVGTPQGRGTVVVNVNGLPSNAMDLWITGVEVPAFYDVRPNLPPTKAKVLFLAICGFTQNFIPFWNVPTSSHALVYPSYTNNNLQLNLGWAANDAEDFMYDMATGQSVAAALADANASASRQNEQLTWTFYGDNTTAFLPPQ